MPTSQGHWRKGETVDMMELGKTKEISDLNSSDTAHTNLPFLNRTSRKSAAHGLTSREGTRDKWDITRKFRQSPKSTVDS